MSNPHFIPPESAPQPGLTAALNLDGIRAILRAYAVRRASVFGSYARGTQHATSDMDLLIDAPRGMTLLRLAELQLALEDLLGLPVHLVTFAELHPRMRDQVLREKQDIEL